MNIPFQNFLLKLGFSEKELQKALLDNIFYHEIETDHSISVKYIYTSTESDIFKYHQLMWNRNSDPVFIAVSKNKSYLINVKEKPDKEHPLKNSICIKSFNYGINSTGFENIDLILISKNSIDSAYFFNFVTKNQRKGQTVDKDLLLNLLALKNDLIKKGNERIIHLLILRCLFIKYLEDRGIFEKDYLINILENQNAVTLKNAFDEVAKINGDIFKFDKFEINDIKLNYLSKLAHFFKSDYRSPQLKLFPYKFDEIPIQLISHVYEAFLKGSAKKGKGIYYTPPFLVNFMLSQTFAEKVNQNPKAKILDPAVGSGAFLVDAFKMIQDAYGKELDFSTKKKILEEQLFGIDVDQNALQIAAFSLYLALLETEDPSFIRAEIKRANPILPSLIGKTLIHGNTITDDIFSDEVFDCISSNPPWGSVPTESISAFQNEREAIDNPIGNYPEYEHVADYERSQAFLTRVSKWGNKNTLFVMVVKNSIFLNDKTRDFRLDILRRYQINIFYELSHYNKILFKKSTIGEIDGKKIELGASEPCVVLIFQQKYTDESIINYISPKLTDFSEHFEIIHYINRDKFELKQSAFIKKDSLWKVLVNGDVEDYELIESLSKIKDQPILICGKGFEPKRNEPTNEKPRFRDLIKSEDFERFKVKKINTKFNWNQKLRRPSNPELFKGERVLVANRPKPKDKFRLRAVRVSGDLVFRNDIFGLKFKNTDKSLFYLGLINSSLFGYFLFHNSVQWLGGNKRDSLRKSELLQLPFLDATKLPGRAKTISAKVNSIINYPNNSHNFEAELDEMVFDLYGLLDYEKEIIREFYQIRAQRADAAQSRVKSEDIFSYHKAFKDTFSLILSGENSLTASFHISSNIGTVIRFSIVGNNEATSLKQNSNLEILNFVKSKQLKKSDSLKILFEEKVKIYDNDKFYIIKSNQFKDWTVKQAIKDAKEEIEEFINHFSAVK